MSDPERVVVLVAMLTFAVEGTEDEIKTTIAARVQGAIDDALAHKLHGVYYYGSQVVGTDLQAQIDDCARAAEEEKG